MSDSQRNDDRDALGKIHREAERLHKPAPRRTAPVERSLPQGRGRRVATAPAPSAPPDDPWVQAAADTRRREAERSQRRSNRRPTDPEGWPSYSRAQSNDRRISDTAGWVLVGIAVVVLLIVIAAAIFVIGRITGGVIVPPLPFV